MSLQNTKTRFEQAKTNLAVNQKQLSIAQDEIETEFKISTIEEATALKKKLEAKVISLTEKRDRLVEKASRQLDKFDEQ